MHKILWIGSPFFASSLQRCGWDVQLHNFEDTRAFFWQDIVDLAGGAPDVLVVADKSRPPFVLGMENFPCLTVFYCVDSHIHSYYPYYAQGFDLCLVSLKDHIPLFENKHLAQESIIHMPPFAKDNDLPKEAESSFLDFLFEEAWDLLFVGTVNPETTPARKIFLDHLKELIPSLHVTKGNYRELYPKAKIVLNHCEFGDLNFRVFEALGCKSCLLTPLVGHGMNELFTVEEELFTYKMGSPEDAAAKAKYLLERPELCAKAALAGFEKINKAHRAIHRAELLTNTLLSLGKTSAQKGYKGEELAYQHIVAKRLNNAKEIHSSYLRFIYLLLAEKMSDSTLKKAYLTAAQ